MRRSPSPAPSRPAPTGRPRIAVSKGTATVKLAGTATQGTIWKLTLDGVAYTRRVAGDTLEKIAVGLVSRVNTLDALQGERRPERRDSFAVSVVDPFYADFRITPATDGIATVAVEGGT